MKKIFFVAALLAFGFTNASAQYDSRYDGRDHGNGDYRQDRSDYRYGNRDDYRNGKGSEVNHLQREARQQIAAGIQRGTLTSREANALMAQYENIELRERKYSRRGNLSARETRMLREDLHRLMADTRRLSDRRGDHWARDRRRY